MSLCPRCKHHFRTLPDEVGDHPCPSCGLSPWDVLLNGREKEPTETPEDRETMTPNIALQMAWLQGYIEGLKAYAWWKDGTQYVGSCGTTLKEALEQARREYAVQEEQLGTKHDTD